MDMNTHLISSANLNNSSCNSGFFALIVPNQQFNKDSKASK